MKGKTRIPTVQIKGDKRLETLAIRPVAPTAKFLDGQTIAFLLFCETGERFRLMSVDEFSRKFLNDSSPAHPNQVPRSRLYDETSTLNSGAHTRPTSRGGKKSAARGMVNP